MIEAEPKLMDRIRGWVSASSIAGKFSRNNRSRSTGSRADNDKKASRRASAEPPGNSPISAVTTVTAFWLKGTLGTGLVMLLACAAGMYAWMANEDAHRLHRLTDYSTMIVRDIERRVTSLQELLRELGADPNLRAVFQAESLNALQSQEKLLARRIPDALRVRLVKLDGSGIVELQTEPLSFAGLELIHQAKRHRSVTLLEAHRLGNPDAHMAIAAPVFDEQDEAVLGVIHISLPTSLLLSLANMDGEAGHIAFQQEVAEQAATVPVTGDATIPSGLVDHQVSIQGTRLRLVAWIGNRRQLDTRVLLPAIVAYLVLMALIMLVTWLPLRGLRRAMATDFRRIVTLVEDAVSRKPIRHPQCQLAETKPMMGVLTGLLRRLQPPQKPEPQALVSPPRIASAQAVAPPGQAEKASTEQTEAATAKAATDGSAETISTLGAESVPAHIFRANDIRGIADEELSAELVYNIGLAIGTAAKEAGGQAVIIGRDMRPSSQKLSKSLAAGLRRSGRDVLDLGVVPTPLVYFATRFQGETSGAIVTASHHPENYNELKVLIGGSILGGDRIAALRERILAGSFSQGDGDYKVGDMVSNYIAHIAKDVAFARTLKVVIDCGNATTAVVAPRLYQTLGCDLIELDCDPDASIPDAHVPDPACPEGLEILQQAVVSQGANLGLAFDDDGNRLGVVDSSGKIIWPDRVLMLLAADILSRHPGTDVIFDVMSSHHLITEINRHGGRPVMCKSGHASLKAKLRETGSLLAGDRSGHIIFRERWFGFDDALYSGARLLEILALDPRPSAEIFAELPEAIGTPGLLLPLDEGKAESVMDAVFAQARELEGMDLHTEDGLRAESAQGWGLVRPSGTRPALVFRFEANDKAQLTEIQNRFRRMMERAAPELQLPF